MNVYHIIEQITGLSHTPHLFVGFPPATNLSVVEMGLGIGKLGIKSLSDLLGIPMEQKVMNIYRLWQTNMTRSLQNPKSGIRLFIREIHRINKWCIYLCLFDFYGGKFIP